MLRIKGDIRWIYCVLELTGEIGNGSSLEDKSPIQAFHKNENLQTVKKQTKWYTLIILSSA